MRTFVAIIASAILLSSCSHVTVAPREVVSEQASFDKNTKNSGVISSDGNGFIVTEHFLDRHGLKHGYFLRDAGVSDDKHGNFRITAELMAQCVEQDRQRKNKQK